MNRHKAAPKRLAPTERQLDAAMDAFHKLKLRYQLMQVHPHFVIVRVLPEMMGRPGRDHWRQELAADHRQAAA
jgi:hypothetical protein